jgi:hypothetical protein
MENRTGLTNFLTLLWIASAQTLGICADLAQSRPLRGVANWLIVGSIAWLFYATRSWWENLDADAQEDEEQAPVGADEDA